MNINEWNKLAKERPHFLNRRWDNASREIQRTLKYNSNPNATVRHHLRDTEEQRKYNDKYYELWGFEIDENGNEHFEYGKYVIFVTPEEHLAIHHVSEETRKKISESLKGRIVSEITRQKISIACKGNVPPNKGIPHSEETRKKISENTRIAMTAEAKKKCSEAHMGIHPSDETRQKMSDSAKSRVDDNFRNKMRRLQSDRMSEEYKSYLGDKMRLIMHLKKSLYKEYKESGGTLLWNEFQTYIKENNLISYNLGDK